METLPTISHSQRGILVQVATASNARGDDLAIISPWAIANRSEEEGSGISG
jgi:hypothetical protein